MTRVVLFLCAFSCLSLTSLAQNMQILYDFDELPQILLLNPGSEVSYDKHIGIPFLSNVYAEFGASNSNITYNNVIAGTDSTTEILRNIYDQNLSSNDVFTFNQQIELFTMGFRLKNPDYYLSFGMYQQANGFGKYPEDIADIYYNGNDVDGDGIPETGQPYSIDQFNVIGDVSGVFHIGISKKMNDRFTLGGRFKLLSGSVSLKSTSNTGVYQLGGQIGGLYNHRFDQMDLLLMTSGLIDVNGNQVLDGASDLIPGLFFMNGNIGVGFDMGFTAQLEDDLTVTGSVLDLGFVNYGNEVTRYEIKEDFSILDDEYFDPPEGNEFDYWRRKFKRYHRNQLIPLDTLTSSYVHTRSPKVNGSIKKTKWRRSKGNPSAFRNVSCDEDQSAVMLSSSYGLQVYNEFRPRASLWAVTAFYTRELTPYLNTKFTYTVDRFSSTNLGFGLSTRIKQFNLFATADNLVALFNIRNSNYQSFQVGMNLIL